MLAVLLHWLIGGVAAATATAGFANGALVERGRNDRVEWLYAFDVHCNAFFAAFLVGSVGLCVRRADFSSEESRPRPSTWTFREDGSLGDVATRIFGRDRRIDVDIP